HDPLVSPDGRRGQRVETREARPARHEFPAEADDQQRRHAAPREGDARRLAPRGVWPAQEGMTAAAARLDKWLWAVRLFRTRSLATDAYRAGSVAVNDQPAKPSRDIRAGEVITVKQGLVTRIVR